MGLLSDCSEPEWALWVDSASFRTILNRDVTTTGRHANHAAAAADPNALAFTMKEMAYDDKRAGVSENKNRKTSMRTDFLVIRLSREE